MVEVNFKPPFIHRREPMEVARFPGYRSEDKGTVDTGHRWTDRVPHPTNMDNYDKWANDPEANIAFDVLTDIIAGVGYYTEMSKKKDKDHPNKKVIDDYGETVNLDEDLQEITMAMLQKGFCPVQRLEDYDLHILPPETFFIWQTKTGTVYRYTQERTQGDIIRAWQHPRWKSMLKECKEAYDDKTFQEFYEYELPSDLNVGSLDEIILFFHRKTTSWRYGKSLTEPIGTLLDDRDQMNKDMMKAVHRWGYPIPIMQTSKPKAALQKELEDREADEWILIGNVMKDEVSWDTVKIDPQARFVPYIELIYYQICEGLHAPLLLYLKNATEASATVMMESVDRLTGGIQRYIKRRVERFLFEPQCGDPVPRLVWGQPKTGLEEIELSSIAQLVQSGAIMPNQAQDLLKKLGLDLIEPIEPPKPQMPFPFQKQPDKPIMTPPIEQLLDKLNDLSTQLDVIYTNFEEKRLPLVKAMQLGGKAIEVYMKRAYGSGDLYDQKRDEEFEKWTHRLIGVAKEKGKEFKVIVPPD